MKRGLAVWGVAPVGKLIPFDVIDKYRRLYKCSQTAARTETVPYAHSYSIFLIG